MTTAPPVTLAAWLLERLAEDEKAARSVLDNPPYFQQLEWGWFDADFGDFHPAEYGKSGVGLPKRVLAECEAKRRVIAIHMDYDCTAAGQPDHETCGEREWCYNCGEESSWPCDTLLALALPHADAPGYREEWRP